MYNFNKGWNKFVVGIINNVGWILVIVLAILTLLFAQLGTWHPESGTLSDLYNSHEEYGNIHGVVVDNDAGETQSIRAYYSNRIDSLKDEIILLRTDAELYLSEGGTVDDGAYVDLANEITAAENERARYNNERNLIGKGTLKGIGSDTQINTIGNYNIRWVGEYTYDKILYLAVTDFYSWMMALLIAFSAVVIKVQGNRTGKNSGLKMSWKVTLRHATLSEKIAPKSKDAEEICQQMNEDELLLKREDKLRYVALKYEDVFTKDGTFQNNPNFVEVETTSYKTLGGKTKFKTNKYQKTLHKKQVKMVEFLKKYRIKEVHTYILLESKAEAKERFDFGQSLKTRERKTLVTNIITSLVTVLPMFGAVSLFVLTNNTSNLILGALGMLFNLVALLFNMFGAYDYILNQWTPGVLKKCDTLLVIGNELGITDDQDNNWDATIETEVNAAVKRDKEISGTKKRK
jgi:hypothetical protein